MKLYQVDRYAECYYKAIHKPYWHPIVTPARQTWEADPITFMQPIIDAPAMIKSELWLPTESFDSPNKPNVDVFYASMLDFNSWFEVQNDYGNAIKPGPIRDQWMIFWQLYHDYFEGGRTSGVTFEQMNKAWKSTWGLMSPENRKYWAARYYWYQIRQSATWRQLQDAYFHRFRDSTIHSNPYKDACEAADAVMQMYTKGKFSIKDVKQELYGKAVSTRILDILKPVFATIWRVLGTYCFWGIAVIALIPCIIDITEKGVRRKFYEGSRFIMTYGNRIWWADLIAKSITGKRIYMRCSEFKAHICRTAILGKKKPLAYEDHILIPDPKGETQEGWYWWLIWPWEISGKFHGYLHCVGGNFYALNDNYSDFECTPVEVYYDPFGNPKTTTPGWWRDDPHTSCSKPTKDWCREPYAPHWILYPDEEPFS